MTGYRSASRKRYAMVSRDVLVVILVGVLFLVIAVALYRYLTRPPTVPPLAPNRYFRCYPDEENAAPITFSVKEWEVRRRELRLSLAEARRPLRLTECGDRWAYPATKCPNDGTVFRHVPTKQEENRGIRKWQLGCPKCGWSKTSKILEDVAATPRAGASATAHIRATPVPTSTPRATDDRIDGTPKALPTAAPVRKIPGI